jgi:uncharacterized caspase-like protein
VFALSQNGVMPLGLTFSKPMVELLNGKTPAYSFGTPAPPPAKKPPAAPAPPAAAPALAPAASSSVPQWPQGAKVALCVGVAAYAAAPLRNSLNDARDMAAALTRVGYATTLVTDPRVDELEAAVGAFAAQLQPGGAGFFFFAGHGAQAEDGTNYLLPREQEAATRGVSVTPLADTQLPRKALSLAGVLAQMSARGCFLNVLVADACRSYPVVRSLRSAPAGFSRMEAPAGAVLCFACAAGAVALDGHDGSRNGVFTKHLLAQLGVPGVDVDVMLRRVARGVESDTDGKQSPWQNHNLRVDKVCLF